MDDEKFFLEIRARGEKPGLYRPTPVPNLSATRVREYVKRVCAGRRASARMLSPISLFLLPWQQAPQPRTLFVPLSFQGSLPIYLTRRSCSLHRKARSCLLALHQNGASLQNETGEEWCGIATCHLKSKELDKPW